MIKQIYASLEIGEQEIRVLVGEYFNTRFNIIKYEAIACDGIENFRVVEPEKVKKTIQKAINNAGKMIGATIERVILMIPSCNFKRYPLKVNVKTTNGYVTKNDVSRAIKKAMKTKVDNDVTIINAVCVRYTVNGISSRRIPEKEISDELTVDIDLLCADKILTFEYASLLDECGIEILDVCLDMYAICKEAALFEQTLNQNIVLMKIQNHATQFALLSKGKLITCETVYKGLYDLAKVVYDQYHFPYSSIYRLLKYNTSYDTEYNDNAIFAWMNENQNNESITEQELSELVEKALDQFVNEIVTTSKPILESSNTTMVVVGEGASMRSLIKKLQKETGIQVKAYFPDTIGVRDSSLVALYGSFFSYRDSAIISEDQISSINLLEFENIIDRKTEDIEGESLTSKIKGLFELNKKKEDEHDE